MYTCINQFLSYVVDSLNNVLNVLIYVLFTCRYLYLLIFNLFITSNIFTNVYHDVVCKQFQFRHLFFCKRYVLFYILLRPFIDKNVDIDFRALLYYVCSKSKD